VDRIAVVQRGRELYHPSFLRHELFGRGGASAAHCPRLLLDIHADTPRVIRDRYENDCEPLLTSLEMCFANFVIQNLKDSGAIQRFAANFRRRCALEQQISRLEDHLSLNAAAEKMLLAFEMELETCMDEGLE
jgi:hypothetical protein